MPVKSLARSEICQLTKAIIPAIKQIKIRIHAPTESPRLTPFFSNLLLIGRKSIERIPAMVSGTRKGLAKYNPAKTAKNIMNR
jgi:hypothetical protein